jgi:hypothetical protein
VRVAVDNFGSTEPSSSTALRRFSPVRDDRSRRVPVLYAGEDLACALGETVFHDLPDDPTTTAEVFRADLLTLRAGTIALRDRLQLADLTDPALVRYGFHRSDVIDTDPVDYPTTRHWGQHVWDTTRYAGLLCNSRRSPDRIAVLLFVNPPRVADRRRSVNRRSGLVAVKAPLPLHDGDGLAAVMDAAASRNVTIII